MVKIDTEDYETCNSTLGTVITAVETDITTYITETNNFLASNKLGNSRMEQMGLMQTFLQTTIQGILQTIEEEKNTAVANCVTAVTEMDTFL